MVALLLIIVLADADCIYPQGRKMQTVTTRDSTQDVLESICKSPNVDQSQVQRGRDSHRALEILYFQRVGFCATSPDVRQGVVLQIWIL